jgi:hypothetical protein
VFEAFFDALAAMSQTAHWSRCSTPPLFGHMSRRLEPKGAGRTGAGPLARGLLDQDPPQG